MGRQIIELAGGSLLVGNLPKGCELCSQGKKMVLFVTGICASSCHYCPLSSEKANKDVTFVDEMPVVELTDLIKEARAIGAEGTGLSGGDPLCKIERTIEYIELLKDIFGAEFHTHLYTAETEISGRELDRLISAGLDEIRFHPQDRQWSGIERAISKGLDTGIEIPGLPRSESWIKTIAKTAEEVGVSFLNINELESSETNFGRLASLGFRLRSMDTAAIEGSLETAEDVVNWSLDHLDSLSVHYCSADFKDGVQMRNRLKRRLERTIRPFEEAADYDTLLILGVIRAPKREMMSTLKMNRIRDLLIREFNIPKKYINLDDMRKRVEIAPWILEEIACYLKDIRMFANLELGIAREYPSWDRLQVQFDPL